MSILCIGQTTYDMIFTIPARIEENSKKRVLDRNEMVGGPATCAAGVSSKWGIKTYLLSRVGDDFIGNGLINELEKYHIDTTYVKRLNNATSAFSMVLNHNDNGNRTIFNDAGDLREEEFDIPEDVDVILLDGHEVETSLKAIEVNPNAISILDGGSVREETLTLAKAVDYLVCSEVFASQFTNLDIDYKDEHKLREIFDKLKTLCPKVIITIGEKGMLYEENDIIKHMSAFECECIDTTGAGDIFHGCFAYGIHQKMKLTDIIELSSAASGLSIKNIGGIASIPKLEDVLNLVKSR